MSMGFLATYSLDGRIHAKYLLANKPDARIAVLYQNDDYGKEHLKGLKEGLGAQAAKMIVAEATYEVTDATIDSRGIQPAASQPTERPCTAMRCRPSP